VGEIRALAGVDFLTISPNLLEELKKSTDSVPKKLDANYGKRFDIISFSALAGSLTRRFLSAAQSDPIPKVTYVDNEPEFRWTLLQDQMAFDKLHEGIKKFAEDGETLKKILREKLAA
jgi:transaldolase